MTFVINIESTVENYIHEMNTCRYSGEQNKAILIIILIN